MPKPSHSIDADRSDAAPGPEPSRALAERIRSLRDERGWTLEVASERTGVSRSALSKIEREEMSPTFNALHKLASGFGVGMSELLDGQPRARARSIVVSRSGEGSVHATSQYRMRLLGSGVQDGSSLVAVEFMVEATDVGQFERWDRHDDENFVYVLDGPIAFHTEAEPEPVILRSGDGVCFDARVGHAFTAVGGLPGRALSVTVRAQGSPVPYSGAAALVR